MNNDKYNSNLISLPELFKDKFFVIPDYQRNYSWDTDQIDDLMKDIENISTKDYRHYSGTIVLTETDPIKHTYDIIDGQQRITSLVLCLKVIYDIDPTKYTHLFSEYIAKGSEGDSKPILLPNIEIRDYFRELLLKTTPTCQDNLISHKRLANTIAAFRKWITDQNADLILNAVLNKLGFLVFSTPNTNEVGIMFEVINNRGKELSELEKIKNYLIYLSSLHGFEQLRNTINTNWTKIQGNLSQADVITIDDENSFLRYCYLVYFEPNKSKSWDVYHELKKVYPPSLNDLAVKIEKYVEFIASASQAYAYFFNREFFRTSYNDNGKQNCKDNLDRVLTYLRCHPVNASIMPIYLSAMTRLSDQPDKVIKILQLLEIVNFRIYVLPEILRRTDSEQGNTFFFANEFFNYPKWNSANETEDTYTQFNKRKVSGDIFDWLIAELEEFILSKCPIHKLIEALALDTDEDYNFYNWPGIRYFLARYEECLCLADKQSWDVGNILKKRADVSETLNDYLSLEHLWASKNRVEDFPEDNLQKRRLGNFVLLGLSANIQQSAADLPDKVTTIVEYNKNGTGSFNLRQVAQLSADLAQAQQKLSGRYKSKNYWKELSTHLNDIRETKLIRFALEKWNLPNEDITVFNKIDSFTASTAGTSKVYQLKKSN